MAAFQDKLTNEAHGQPDDKEWSSWSPTVQQRLFTSGFLSKLKSRTNPLRKSQPAKSASYIFTGWTQIRDI